MKYVSESPQRKWSTCAVSRHLAVGEDDHSPYPRDAVLSQPPSLLLIRRDAKTLSACSVIDLAHYGSPPSGAPPATPCWRVRSRGIYSTCRRVLGSGYVLTLPPPPAGHGGCRALALSSPTSIEQIMRWTKRLAWTRLLTLTQHEEGL